MNKLLIILFIQFLFFCKTKEFQLVGITSKEKEIYYFGKNFAVSLTKLEKDDIEKLKRDLKNSFSLFKQENPEKIWEEINSLSFQKNQFFIFQILPETRVFPEFVEFVFESEKVKPSKVYSYYFESLQSTVRSRYFYPGVGFLSGGFVYPTGSYPIETDVQIQLIHQYNFVLLFPVEESISKIRVKTKNGNFIDFEKRE